MNISIDITDEKQLALIDQLRSDMPAGDYVRLCIAAGLQMAATQREHYKQAEARGQLLRFASAKPEFRTLDAASIAAALKDTDPQNPIRQEVTRLVQDITGQLKQHAEKNGNKLPSQLRVNAQAPIEKIAFQITSEMMRATAQQNNTIAIAR